MENDVGLGILSYIPDDMMSKAFENNPTLLLVSKHMRRALQQCKPNLHVRLDVSYNYNSLIPTPVSDRAQSVQNLIEHKQKIGRFSEFYTITKLTYEVWEVGGGGRRLSDPDLAYWSEIFQYCPELEELTFNGLHTFKVSHFPNLGLALQNNPSIHLKRLNLWNQSLNCDRACRFLDLLRNSSSGATLAELDLGHNSFCTMYTPNANGTETSKTFGDVAERLSHLPALKSLSLSKILLNYNFRNEMQTFVREMGPSKLEHLNMCNLRDGSNHPFYSEVINKNLLPLLKALEGCALFKNLTLLQISGNPGLDDNIRSRFGLLGNIVIGC